MDDGEHKDFGRTALPLLHPGSDAATSSQKLLAFVTLAALVIAGSTLAYRTRSYPFSTLAPAAARQEDGNPSGIGKDQVQSKQMSNSYVDAPGEGSVNGEEGDDSRSQAEGSEGGKEKEGKSSRKKDRRKRGKDPLKEILKGKSKGKALEQLLESNAQTSIAPSSPLLKATNKPTNIASGIPIQKLSNGSTSGADADPEKASTQLADVSQKPHRPTAGLSPSTQSNTPLSLSTTERNPSKQRTRSPEVLQLGARTNGDPSPPLTPSDTASSIPASASLHSEALTAAYGVDGDGDPNNTRSVFKNDQALGVAAGGLAVDAARIVSSTSTTLPFEIEGESAGETETSTGVSMSSSIVLSESGVVHAHGAEEAEITPVTSPASSEKSGRTHKVKGDTVKVAPTISERKARQPSANQALVDPWDWDGGSTDVASSIASTSSKTKKTMNTASSRGPLPGSSTTPVHTSFSSAVLSNKGKALASSNSLDPLSDSNEPSFKMSTSTSAPGVTSTRNDVSSSPSAKPAESDPQRLSKDKEEEETVFTFPTLNPPSSAASAGAGPSRIRLTLGDIHSSTLTGRASPSIGAKRRPPTPSRNNSHSHSRNASSGGTPPPQRPMTPNSASAPGSESPTPSQAKPALSVQTQLASMRGALEASRLREEKNKVEIEKYMKEIETMKWESANWRRAEIELQTQIRNLMHQLQIYTSVFAANVHLQQQYAANNAALGPTGLNTGSSPSPLYSANPAASSSVSTPQQPSTSSDRNADDVSSAPSQSSQQTGPPSSQASNPTPVPHHSVPQPLSLHMLHMNGVASPPTILSPSGPMSPGFPLGPYPGAPPPFFPYAIPPHLQSTSPHFPMAHAQHMHMQSFHPHQASIAQTQAQALPSPHQASLFSAMFPPPQQHGAASQLGSTPSSAAGTSSVGSQSPDRSGSPISGPFLSNRRSRPRMQTANSRIGGRSTWEEVGDGWVGNDGETRSNAHELSDDDAGSEGGFNEVLADAIFKRPASIRVRSSSRSLRSAFEADKNTKGGSTGTSPGAQASEEAEHFTEFAFPSLTDMGNIIYQSSVKSTNGAHSSGTSTSTSSSLPLSPADTSDIPPELPEGTTSSNDAEGDRQHSLPPVIEQPEDGEGLPKADAVVQALPQIDQVTPKQGPDPGTAPQGEFPLRTQSSTSAGLSEASPTGGEVEPEDLATPASADQ
ncbi:hypothetical protein D9619_013555 [Psilocybe cf. subviscida]|uniref:Uncharacterized protein n=1 Tax=Psilocybe cf. subviscida TaxID=2480587 RepID=A0A8H5EQC3_9AGAR|nr:hypothetical protein D9619_013555 [Psilocybe cf. subviscida]